jgi:hypothetical protein
MFAVDANVAGPVTTTTLGQVSYRFTVPETTIDATYKSSPIGYQLENIVATDEELNQSTSLVYYGITFIPYPHGPLEGSMVIRVDGGLFPIM